MENRKDASKILGIVGLCTGWIIPLAGAVCGIVGLCVRKHEDNYNLDIALNIMSIVASVIAWVFWMSLLFPNW